MSTDQALSFPFAATGTLELPGEFAALRAGTPVAPVTLPTGDRAWLVTRYADVRSALADSRLSRAAAEAPDAPRMGNTRPGAKTILGMDPPDHTRLRRLVMQAFTARRVAALRRHIREQAEELAGLVLVAPRPVDLMSCFVTSLPIKVIFELLGVPWADRDRLHALSEIIFALGERTREEVAEARTQIESYLADLIALRRAEPADDLLGLLVHARDEENRLTEEELLNFALILLTVGHQSTANTLGSALFLLLRHPDQLAALRADPGLIGPAVEELLRFNPFVFTGTQLRVALEDMELGGVTVRAGEAVICALGSANHDESVFDDPGRLDITRAVNPHLAFGFGIHHCLGAQLARLEMQVAIETLVRRLPADAHLAVPEHWLTWKTGLTARALVNLPVTW
ncbi:cytochrome P450 [Actinoplanes sp. RD1]|uniref:cytochrome P450 n=1 Tax=Actinoplanes sp. RD1 TaxID=3064538 RepID=UPI0027418AD2|nr:cytochrome P450 [Actinoplanes sp. RD1]